MTDESLIVAHLNFIVLIAENINSLPDWFIGIQFKIKIALILLFYILTTG